MKSDPFERISLLLIRSTALILLFRELYTIIRISFG
jgi:hypothetical protein